MLLVHVVAHISPNMAVHEFCCSLSHCYKSSHGILLLSSHDSSDKVSVFTFQCLYAFHGFLLFRFYFLSFLGQVQLFIFSLLMLPICNALFPILSFPMCFCCSHTMLFRVGFAVYILFHLLMTCLQLGQEWITSLQASTQNGMRQQPKSHLQKQHHRNSLTHLISGEWCFRP